MAQTGYTPIQLYYSTTTSNTPSAGNLASGELAINITDGKLFYKDNGGVVRVIAQTSSVTNVASISFGTTGLTPSTATTGAVTVAGTLATTNGGTGLTSFTANGVVYASSSSALTTGSALTFDGTNFVNTAGYLGTTQSGATSSYYIAKNSAASSGVVFGAHSSGAGYIDVINNNPLFFAVNDTEQMRLTSTGLGIGTSSPSVKLDVYGSDPRIQSYNSSGPKNILLAGGTVGYTGTTTNHPLAILTNDVERARFDTSGNLGLGVTPSAWGGVKAFQFGAFGSASSRTGGSGTYFSDNVYFTSDPLQTASNGVYIGTSGATSYLQWAGQHRWYNAPSGTAGNAISFTQAMTLDASGNLGVGVTSIQRRLHLGGGANDAGIKLSTDTSGNGNLDGADITFTTSNVLFITNRENGPIAFEANGAERARITSAGFTQPVAYADTVSALGNTGTAKTIDLQTANVFTATLTGNCTFTLSNPIATGSSSFTLILTNDGTAGRTVAWAGGSFVFPGGAAALSRTTTANAVDVWVFFTPNGGSTWYGNIAMKDMKA